MIALLILAAILPSLVLMFIIWKEDKIEKESPKLLLRLFLLGIAAASLSVAAENVLTIFVSNFISEDSPAYVFIDNFLIVAVCEEFFKFILCFMVTWKNPEFNYRFDAVVYTVFTSLGFAAMENVLYGISFGVGVLPVRAIVSIPAHLAFAVFMGTWYGTAKIYNAYNAPGKARFYIIVGYIIAVLLHGFYDTAATLKSGIWLAIFLAFVIVMDIAMIITVKRDSKDDRLIHY